MSGPISSGALYFYKVAAFLHFTEVIGIDKKEQIVDASKK
jgi:hypothetical protein